jgi:uncharacterized protein (DUF302 family)
MRCFARGLLAIIAVAVTLAAIPSVIPAAQAEDIRRYSTKAKFDDVRLELDTAIIARGLAVHSTGNIAAMLDRTGADVGSTKPIYIAAEFVTFCSAKTSRLAMEADPLNIALCPFAMFIYQSVAKPDEITVGYRRPLGGSGETAAAYAAVDALLDGIAKDAVK